MTTDTAIATIMLEFPANTIWSYTDENDPNRVWNLPLIDMADPVKTVTYLVGRGQTINMQNCKALSNDQKAAMKAKGKDVEKYILDRRNRLNLGYMNGDFDDTAGAPRLSPEEIARREVTLAFIEAALKAQGEKDGKTYRLPTTQEALAPIFEKYLSKPANKAKVDKEVARRLSLTEKATDTDGLADLADLAAAGLEAEKAKREAAAAKAKADKEAKELADLGITTENAPGGDALAPMPVTGGSVIAA